VAAALLIGCLPVLALCLIAVKATSPGPFLFKQVRPGLRGKLFGIYKIRTMTLGCEKATALGVSDAAPAVTRVGRLLRTLKLDELPQLYNIAAGDMLFIGPRPIPVPLDKHLRQLIPGFEMRYRVQPGLSALGQICLYDNKCDTDLKGDWQTRFEGELHYIRHRCVTYDALMMFMTCLFFLKKCLYFIENCFRRQATPQPTHAQNLKH
jgi:putative colanic acid biosynthesis UDP-glucose lipid carrier transferase